MKASVEKLYNLGVDTVEISLIESKNIAEQVLNNAISDVLITDYSDKDLTEFEALFILIVMGYFDKFVETVKRDYAESEYYKIEDIYKSREFGSLQRDLLDNITFNREELLKSVSTIYDFNKKLILDKYGVTFSNRIDEVSKELLTKKLMDDLYNLVQDYNRTLSKMINSNINLTVDDLLKNLDKLRNDVPLVNRDGKATTTLTSRIRAIARTTETLVKAQAIFNTGLQLGLDEYNIITMKDGKVCSICLDLEAGNPYNIDSGDLPPFHNYCRCTIQFILDSGVNSPRDVDKFYDIASKSWISV